MTPSLGLEQTEELTCLLTDMVSVREITLCMGCVCVYVCVCLGWGGMEKSWSVLDICFLFGGFFLATPKTCGSSLARD